MSKITTHKDELKILYPGAIELISSIALLIVLFVLANTNRLSNLIVSSSGPNFSESLNSYLESYRNFMDESAFASIASTALVWAGIGALIYLIIMGVVSVLSSTTGAFKDTVLYKHPENYNPAKVYGLKLLKWLITISAAILTVLLGAFLANVAIPWVAASMTLSDTETVNIAQLGLSIMFYFFVFHLTALAFRLTVYTVKAH